MDSLLLVALGAAVILGLQAVIRRFWSFKAQVPSDYVEGQPQFDLRRHLNGPILCEGVIYGPLGRVTSRFVGEFDAQWDGNSGVMKERFTYDNGSVQDREWHLRLGNDGSIKATAPDVVGTGTGTQTLPGVSPWQGALGGALSGWGAGMMYGQQPQQQQPQQPQGQSAPFPQYFGGGFGSGSGFGGFSQPRPAPYPSQQINPEFGSQTMGLWNGSWN
jgi:hypothetical protein